MAYTRKDKIVVATAPDGEIIGYGLMTMQHAEVLVDEINSREGWSAVMPIFGSAHLWPSSYEYKTGETFEPGVGYAVHLAKREEAPA